MSVVFVGAAKAWLFVPVGMLDGVVRSVIFEFGNPPLVEDHSSTLSSARCAVERGLPVLILEAEFNAREGVARGVSPRW